jgi:hypothetical protein
MRTIIRQKKINPNTFVGKSQVRCPQCGDMVIRPGDARYHPCWEAEVVKMKEKLQTWEKLHRRYYSKVDLKKHQQGIDIRRY